MAELQTVVNVVVLVPREGAGTIPDIPTNPNPNPFPDVPPIVVTNGFILRDGSRLVDRFGKRVIWRETSRYFMLRGGGRLTDRNGKLVRYR